MDKKIFSFLVSSSEIVSLKFFLSLYLICYNIDSVFFFFNVFCLLFFGPEARGIVAPRPGLKPTPSALEGEVPTTRPPGKSP